MRGERCTAPKSLSSQPIFPNTDNNIPDSEFLSHLSGDINHALLSPNTYGNIPGPDFLARLAGEINQNLEGMK